MTSTLTTFNACRAYMATTQVSASASVNPTEDATLSSLIPIASQAIEDYCGNSFAPYLETRDFDVKIGANELHFKGNLALKVVSVTTPDGLVLDPTQYQVMPPNRTPKRAVLLTPGNYWQYSGQRSVYDNSQGFSSFTYGTAGSGAYQTHIADGYLPSGVSVNAYWGYHKHYASAWRLSAGSVGVAMLGTDNTLTLAISSALAGLDIGSFIQIDQEFMAVTYTTAIGSAVVLNVARAQNGTVTAPHALNAPISVWQVEPIVEWSARVVVAALYKSRDNPAGDSVFVDGLGSVKLIAHGLPQKVMDQLAEYRNYWSGH